MAIQSNVRVCTTTHLPNEAPYASAPTPSFHPMGIKAAATSETPRSVASRLNCAAAFLVSKTSTLIPSSAMCFLVSGLSGRLCFPTPMTSKSKQRGPLECDGSGCILAYCHRHGAWVDRGGDSETSLANKKACPRRSAGTYPVLARGDQISRMPPWGDRIDPSCLQAPLIPLPPMASTQRPPRSPTGLHYHP